MLLLLHGKKDTLVKIEVRLEMHTNTFWYTLLM